jgi:hypothetical protein
MGVQVIRLYDWDPRNDHSGFLDMCLARGLRVLVGVSDYFLQSGQDGGFDKMEEHIPRLI